MNYSYTEIFLYITDNLKVEGFYALKQRMTIIAILSYRHMGRVSFGRGGGGWSLLLYVQLSHKSHARKLSRNGVGRGYLVAVTGSMYIAITVYVAVMGSIWQLHSLCGCYGVYMAITVYVAVMGSMWQLHVHSLCGCYGVYVAIVYVAVTGSMWLLWGLCGNYSLCGCYGVYVAITVYVAVMGSMWQLHTCTCT